MQFDIDYDRAKAMAWRLQDFLKDKPDEKLTRSSSIEAVALMLGFPNRNTMAALMGEARELRASSAGMQARQEGWTAELISKPSGYAPRDIVMGTLTGVWLAEPDLSAEIEACAAMLVEAGRAVAPEKPFTDAMHSDTETGDNVMIAVEDRIARTYGAITAFLSVTGDMARGTDAEEEFREARRVRKDERSATALALVNLSLPRAEEMWGKTAAEKAGNPS